MKRYMKFIKWDMDKALFRPATRWERIRAWWHYLFTNKPDPENLILDFKEADEILAEYKTKKLKIRADAKSHN